MTVSRRPAVRVSSRALARKPLSLFAGSALIRLSRRRTGKVTLPSKPMSRVRQASTVSPSRTRVMVLLGQDHSATKTVFLGSDGQQRAGAAPRVRTLPGVPLRFEQVTEPVEAFLAPATADDCEG